MAAKSLKRVLSVAGISLLVILGILFTLPFFFKGKIESAVKTAANENINARLDFGSVDLSFIRSFPYLNLRLQDLSILGVDEFEGYPLATMNTLELSVNWWGALTGSGAYEVRKITMDHPRIQVLILENGKANYDIALPDTTTAPKPTEAPTPFQVALKQFAIEKGYLSYIDRPGNMAVVMTGLDHQGSADFTASVYDLQTKTSIDSLSFTYSGMSYLSDAKARMDATINADLDQMKFTLKDNQLQVNEFPLAAKGWIQLKEDAYPMDLSFESPQSDFKALLSIIPSAYTQDFSKVKTSGKYAFKGFAKGSYTSTGSMPAFGLDFQIDNGSFQYPSLPAGVNQIFTNVKINSPGADLDQMKIDVPTFKMNINNNPLTGYFYLSTPISDPHVKSELKGSVNLADIVKVYPLQGVEKLAGMMKADVKMDARQSQIDAQRYENINIGGQLQLEGFEYKSSGMPNVGLPRLNMAFSPQFVQIDQFQAKFGKSDLAGSGRIDNILAYFSPGKTLTGKLDLQSNVFDANEWMTPESTTTSTPTSTTTETSSTPPFEAWDFDINARANKIVYADYQIDNALFSGHLTPNHSQFRNFAAQIGPNDISGNGKITNLWDYLFRGETLGGQIQLNSNNMDLNYFMGGSSTADLGTTATQNPAAAAAEPLLIPEHINLGIHANMKNVQYTNLNLKNVTGNLRVVDQRVQMDSTYAQMFGGKIRLDGSYSSKDQEQPGFELKYDISQFDFQQAFQYVNTFQALAPLGKFLNGKFNSTLVMSGLLGKDMLPKFNTLSAAGFLQTLQAQLNNFKPLQQVASQLNVKELGELKLEDTKNWFEIKNGFVEVKPFDYTFKDIAMNIGGKHGLTQDMEYKIKAKIPRKKLESNAVGAAAGKGYNWLVGEANKYGLNIKQSEFVNVLVTLTGSLANPKIAIKPVGGEGEAATTPGDMAKDAAGALAQKAKDSLKNLADQKTNELKDKAKAEADRLAEEARKKAQAEANKVVDQATQKAKEVIGDKAGEAGKEVTKQVEDALNKGTGQTVDDIKKKLDEFKPGDLFKKKKKNQEGGGN